MSVSRQFCLAQDEALHALAGRNRLDDFGHVLRGDVSVKEVIGLNQNRDATGALVEATRGAHTGLKFRQTAGGDSFFQCLPDSFGTARGAGAFFVALSATISANEKVSLTLRHARIASG